MILTASSRAGAERVPLDQMVQSNAQRFGEAVALFDAPDRPLWTEGAPRRLTWAQIDAATTAVAARLIEMGLGSDSVVAIQGPNSSDTLIAVLGCLRANLVPALLPANWRNAEATEAVSRLGARAIFAATRAGSANPADALRYVAADNFSVRFVFGFGSETPDGVVSFEDCIANPRKTADTLRGKRLGNPAEHVAMLTFDCGPGGAFPVARTHNEWLCAAAPLIETAGLSHASVLIATLAPTTLAGLATGLVAWLVAGCTLALHQAFDATVLGVQIDRHAATHVVLPHVATEAVLREHLLGAEARPCLVSIIRRLDTAAARADPSVTQIAAFGEIGLAAPVAGEDGRLRVPLAGPDELEATVTPAGTLALRGAMVARSAFPGAERGTAYPLAEDGFVATGFPAAVEDSAIAVSGPRDDVVSIGGHTLAVAAVESLYADAVGTLSVNAAAMEDVVLGQRLALTAMPDSGKDLSVASLAMHAEAKGASPLAATADAAIGDRRKGTRLAGAA